MLARELPKKRRPTEVSARITGSAGAIGWHNSSLKSSSWLALLGAVGTRKSGARAILGCVRVKDILTKGRVPMNTENLTIHLKVKDFNAWRTSYNGGEQNRLSASITNGRVFRNADDQNDVVILQDVTDVAKARAWLGSTEMKTAMEKSGVVGSPSIRFAAAA